VAQVGGHADHPATATSVSLRIEAAGSVVNTVEQPVIRASGTFW
jgi:hypothetical protein